MFINNVIKHKEKKRFILSGIAIKDYNLENLGLFVTQLLCSKINPKTKVIKLAGNFRSWAGARASQ